MTRTGRFEYYNDGVPSSVTGVPVGSICVDKSDLGQRYICNGTTWIPFGPPYENRYFQVVAAGTVATLVATGTSTLLDFGTTDPTLVIAAKGTYLLSAQVVLDLVGTTVTTQTAAFKLRRTNNTAADVTGATIAIDLPAMTTLTHTLGVFNFPQVLYTTANADDSIDLMGAVSASLGAGSITATAASITAVRLY